MGRRLKMTKEMKDATTTYWNATDQYQQFKEDNIIAAYVMNGDIKTLDLNSSFTVTDLYARYKTWFKETYTSCKPVDKTRFETEMEARLGTRHNRRWRGFKVSSLTNPFDTLQPS